MTSESTTLKIVEEYYGKVLKSTQDLKTGACCTSEAVASHCREVLKLLHPEVLERFYGCGSPIPLDLSGKTVLDLGSGSGRDVFLLSNLVGPSGKVIGVDMTDEQLAIARRHVEFHAQAFGYERTNVELRRGYIEDLAGAGIEANSVDIVISNCVVNLSPDKPRVFAEIFRALKPGGELYFSDVFAGRRVPQHLTEDPILIGECLGGALYFEDFRRLMARVGCLDYRIVSRSNIPLNNPEIERKAGMIDFYSTTVRAFKLDLEDRCEDFGQVASYLGTIPEAPHGFRLDDHHYFESGRPVLVCGNTAAMLQETRYGPHFQVTGDRTQHYGLFNCGVPAGPAADASDKTMGACC